MASADLFVPVDGKGLDWPRRVANAINALRGLNKSLDTRVTALESEGGFGFVDYSDTLAGTPVTLTAGATVQVTRPLSASPTNNRLRGPFEGHAFWDNTASLITPRALYDTIALSIYIKVSPGASGGVLDVALMAGSVDVGTKSIEMTGAVGVAKGLRADFVVAVRSSFWTNGAKVMLTPTVTTDLLEFSPEFYPLGFEP